MSDLVEKLWAYVGTFRDNITLYASHPSVLASEAADAIEDLTAEVTALRAKLAQYEKAEVVGWALHHPESGDRLLANAITDGDRSLGWSDTPLIRKPEVSP